MPDPKPSNTVYNKVLADAIQEIYRVYGPNLSAFFRDVEDPKSHDSCGREFQGHLAEIHPSKRARAHTVR